MATIETRLADNGSKTFRVKVRLKGHPPLCATFQRLTDAKHWAQQTEADIRAGRHFHISEAKRHTFSEVVDRYLAEVLPHRPKNADNTKRHLSWWKAKIGHKLLSDVTPALIVQHRNELLSQPNKKGKTRSGATVLRYLASISHAFNIAMKDWGWVEDNPVAKISKPRAARGRDRFLSDGERAALLEACKQSSSQFLYTVVILAISTGMRRGEIMNMTWDRVDLERRQIRLDQTKNDTPRTIPLAGLALQLMTELSTERRSDTNLVFYGKDLKVPVDLTKPWRTALHKAGVKNFRFHDLRHTAASYLAMNSATTMEIAAVLGHKTLQMVKRYSHLADSHTFKVVTAMNEKIFGVAGNEKRRAC